MILIITAKSSQCYYKKIPNFFENQTKNKTLEDIRKSGDYTQEDLAKSGYESENFNHHSIFLATCQKQILQWAAKCNSPYKLILDEVKPLHWPVDTNFG